MMTKADKAALAEFAATIDAILSGLGVALTKQEAESRRIRAALRDVRRQLAALRPKKEKPPRPGAMPRGVCPKCLREVSLNKRGNCTITHQPCGYVWLDAPIEKSTGA